jgi:hypothetical protein
MSTTWGGWIATVVVAFTVAACATDDVPFEDADVSRVDGDSFDPDDTGPDATERDTADCSVPRAGCPCDTESDGGCCVSYSHLLACEERYIPALDTYVTAWIDVWDSPQCEPRPHPTLPLCDR